MNSVITTMSTALPQVIHSSTGDLYCRQDKTSWCSHIESVVLQGLDAPALWEQFESCGWDEDDEPWEMSVPVMPTEGIYLPVDIVPIRHGVCGVMYTGDGFLNRANLTCIVPGEARRVMREVVIDWFTANAAPLEQERSCKSASHTYQSQLAYRQVLEKGSKKDLFVAAWDLVFRGKCPSCISQKNSTEPSTQWDSDLIPE